MKKRATFGVLAVALLLVWAAGAQEEPGSRQDLTKIFERKEAMIPMRDGVKLHTEIYKPREGSEALPMLMLRTPYGVSAGLHAYSRLLKADQQFYADGYVFVYQDIRGRYGSGGNFEMNRPVHDPKDPQAVDESTDTYDTIEWLLRNVPNNNGRVGIRGVSYDGFLAAMAMVNPHPALKAVSEQACMGDAWMGDDFFHNGAFRLSYGFEYGADGDDAREFHISVR